LIPRRRYLIMKLPARTITISRHLSHSLSKSFGLREGHMHINIRAATVAALVNLLSVTSLHAQGDNPQPTCKMCPGTYIPAEEIQAYIKKAIDEKLIDQQVRDVDIGRSNVGIGLVYRKKLDAPAPHSVAEHDQVSEVYHVIEGSGTLVLGPDILDMKRRPATDRTVREFNGPGNNGTSIRDGKTYNLKAGDVVIIPAGTGHWFTRIDDHIVYLMVRIDPDKVTPHKDEAASQAYLKEPRR
jgi:mannose-6-phosphate isomerase-like protein (cupin superfamily)